MARRVVLKLAVQVARRWTQRSVLSSPPMRSRLSACLLKQELLVCCEHRRCCARHPPGGELRLRQGNATPHCFSRQGKIGWVQLG